MMDEDGVIRCESPEEMRRRIREHLAEERGCSVEEVWSDEPEYEHPDLNEEDWIPADEFYDDE